MNSMLHKTRTVASSPDRRGFTLMEMLMAVTIMAMLMTAIGAAVDGTLGSYSENDKIASATQLGRMILGRMMREIRTCADLDSTGTILDITPQASAVVTDPTRIVYGLVNGVLYRSTTVQGVETVQELLGGADGTSVETFNVLREDDGYGDPVSVTVRLDVGMKGRTFALTTSATIRGGQFQ